MQPTAWTCCGKQTAGTACTLLKVPKGHGSPAINSLVNKCLKSSLVRVVTDRWPGPETGPGTKNAMIFKWVTHMFSLCHSSPTVKLPARNVHTSLPEHCAEIRCCQNSIYLCSCHKELLFLYFSLIERQVCSGAQTGSNRLWQCWEARWSSERTMA